MDKIGVKIVSVKDPRAQYVLRRVFENLREVVNLEYLPPLPESDHTPPVGEFIVFTKATCTNEGNEKERRTQAVRSQSEAGQEGVAEAKGHARANEDVGYEVGKVGMESAEEGMAQDGESIVGGLGWTSLGLQEGSAEIKRVWVEPHYRGGGMGKLMMQITESRCLKYGYTSTCLWSGRRLWRGGVPMLYLKLGYTDTAPFGRYMDDTTGEFFWLQKTLSNKTEMLNTEASDALTDCE